MPGGSRGSKASAILAGDRQTPHVVCTRPRPNGDPALPAPASAASSRGLPFTSQPPLGSGRARHVVGPQNDASRTEGRRAGSQGCDCV